MPRRPPLDDEHRGLLVEVGVHDLADVGAEEVTVGSVGDRPRRDRPPGDLRLTRPARLRALDRIDRRAVQGESRVPRRSAPLRASGIEPNVSSPPSKATSIPEMRGDPSERTVAWSCAGARRRAPGRAARSQALRARTPPGRHREPRCSQKGIAMKGEEYSPSLASCSSASAARSGSARRGAACRADRRRRRSGCPSPRDGTTPTRQPQ